MPPAARWSTLQNSAKQPTIGTVVDDAMVAIERDNPRLKGVLPKEYARPGLDKHRLGELIDLIGTIVLIRTASGEEIAKADLPPDAQSGNESGAAEGPHRGRLRGLHGRPPRPALLQHADSRLPLVLGEKQG